MEKAQRRMESLFTLRESAIASGLAFEAVTRLYLLGYFKPDYASEVVEGETQTLLFSEEKVALLTREGREWLQDIEFMRSRMGLKDQAFSRWFVERVGKIGLLKQIHYVKEQRAKALHKKAMMLELAGAGKPGAPAGMGEGWDHRRPKNGGKIEPEGQRAGDYAALKDIEEVLNPIIDGVPIDCD